jgi:hypothetical protein
VKTDKKDARGIAQLMRLGWFRPVHCKSASAQEVRALLTARRLLQGKLHDVEISVRPDWGGFGALRGQNVSVAVIVSWYEPAWTNCAAGTWPCTSNVCAAPVPVLFTVSVCGVLPQLIVWATSWKRP